MNQDTVFFVNEGNNWFARNKSVLDKVDKLDWPSYLFSFVEQKTYVSSVLELGCSNGYRLNRIRADLMPGRRCVGVDASMEAIRDGRSRYDGLELYQGLLSDIPLNEDFDLVIVNFVLHWVDRKTLIKSICEIDRLVKDGGCLLLGDFLPDYQQRRHYHHLPDENIYTYKQDYAKIFETFGIYKELARFAFDHDQSDGYSIRPTDSASRGFCSLLHKSLDGYYPEV